ncbi:MAG: dihydroneopterin aldolase [Chloroflexi bacterium]|jgi:FolB domain-containing protein|nr:dihydroneopterin aldolase [Chloroflexota bacterium]
MADHVFIRDLLVRAIIGVNPDERKNRQDVLINVTLDVDTRAAGASDNLQDAVDYSALARQITALAEQSSYYLVEALAEAIARACLQDTRVAQVRVRVEKPGAVRFARSVGVEILRARTDAAQ